MRVEILWRFYCKEREKHVEEWIPGKLLGQHLDGRKHVKADCGWEAMDAAPECVRLVYADRIGEEVLGSLPIGNPARINGLAQAGQLSPAAV